MEEDGGWFLRIGFMEVSRKVWSVYPVGEDKYVDARGCGSMCMGAVNCLF